MGCQKEELTEPPLTEVGKESTITLTLQPDETEVVEMNSRALNPEREKYLRNAEIFCYDNKTDRCRWVWVTGTNMVKLNLTEGSWDIYVLGNHEDKLETMPRSELERITKKITSEADLEKYSCLPMRGKVTIDVTGNMRVPIVLTRIVAKVDVSVTVSAAMSAEIRLQSIQLVNVPSNCTYFKTNSPTSAMISYPERSCTNGSTTSFYMLENSQGRVSGITEQHQKNSQNAPLFATYLRIRAIRGAKILDYAIYLGENNTDDFNMRANTSHIMNIIIKNDNEADVRISSYTIDVHSKIEAMPENGYYLSTSPITLSISVGGKHEDTELRAVLTVTSGNLNYFSFLNRTGSIYHIPTLSWNSTVELPIEYTPDSFTQENIRLAYTVSFYDKYGYVTSFEFSYCFAHAIKIYTKWFDGGNGYGSIFSPDALDCLQGGTLSSVFYTVYCPKEGCTLVAEPDKVGRVFYGWYREHNLTGKLSSEINFLYRPTFPQETIYAYFI